MAKAKAAVAEKKEFAWDTETVIGKFTVSEKEEHTVKMCTLNGKQFLVDTKLVDKAKTGWTPVKNTSIPVENMEKLMDIFTDWKFGDAFTSKVVTIEEKKQKGAGTRGKSKD